MDQFWTVTNAQDEKKQQLDFCGNVLLFYFIFAVFIDQKRIKIAWRFFPVWTLFYDHLYVLFHIHQIWFSITTYIG